MITNHKHVEERYEIQSYIIGSWLRGQNNSYDGAA